MSERRIALAVLDPQRPRVAANSTGSEYITVNRLEKAGLAAVSLQSASIEYTMPGPR